MGTSFSQWGCQSFHFGLETLGLFNWRLLQGVSYLVPDLPEGKDSGLFFRPDLVIDPEGGKEFRGLGGRLEGTDG